MGQIRKKSLKMTIKTGCSPINTGASSYEKYSNDRAPAAKAKEVKARRFAQSWEVQARPGIEPGPTWQVLRG